MAIKYYKTPEDAAHLTAKEYLETIRRMDDAINYRTAELDDLMTKRVGIRGISYDAVKVQTTPSGEDFNNRITEKIVDLAREIDREIDGFVDLKHKIIKQIDSIPDERYRAILHKRYVEYKRLELIALEMNYSYDWIRALHICALEDFEERYINPTHKHTDLDNNPC